MKSSNNLLPNADVDVTNVDVDVASAPVSMDQVPKLIYGKGSVSMDQVPVPASFYTATSLAQPYDTYIHGRLENELKKLSAYSTPQTVVRKKMYDIGFIPENRGNLGIGTFHVHEVTRSCYSYPQCPKTKPKSEQLHTR